MAVTTAVLCQLISRLFMSTYFSNHTLLVVVFARYDRRMVVYGYKPDTFVTVYPALQRTDTPRRRIFKNTAVYLADWLTENYRHCLKVRFVLQQLQMAQRAELVNFTPTHHYINHRPTGAGGRNGLLPP